ncbi:DJ-1/PfpI family protein [Niallia sp. 03133]|uniref:DJ-1/PfpI family protein n=1 Tax=Niallia sp. 03133 TaxID=3458060 RepID=UPI00404465AE
MRKALFLAYPQYADFEIAHALFLLKKIGKFAITTATIDGKFVESIGGLHTKSDAAVKYLNPGDFEIILISGGDGVQDVIQDKSIKILLKKAVELDIPIASICASALLLANANILNGKQFTCLNHTYEHNKIIFNQAIYTGNDMEIDGTILTAKGTAFAAFAVSACQQVGLLQDKHEYDKYLNFCKGIGY